MAIQYRTNRMPYRAPNAGRSLPGPLQVARVLMLVGGLVACFGAVYFTVLEPEGGSASGIDWAVGGVLGLASAAYVVAAVGIAFNKHDGWHFAIAAVAVRLVMDAVKLGYHEEGEAVVFALVDLAIVGLLLSGPVRRFMVGER